MSSMTKDQWDRRLEAEENIRQAMPGGELLPVKAVAEFLGVTVKALRSDKKFPIKQVGGRYYVPRRDLVRWIA